MVNKSDIQETEEQIDNQQHGVATDPAEIREKLVVRGITPSVADTLARQFGPRILSKLPFFDHLVKSRSPLVAHNPAGYLRRAIEHDYALPREHVRLSEEQAKKESSRKVTEDRKRLEKDYREYLERRIDEWRKTLDPTSADDYQRRAREAAEGKLAAFPEILRRRVHGQMMDWEFKIIARSVLGLPSLEDWAKSASGDGA